MPIDFKRLGLTKETDDVLEPRKIFASIGNEANEQVEQGAGLDGVGLGVLFRSTRMQAGSMTIQEKPRSWSHLANHKPSRRASYRVLTCAS